MDLFEMFKIFIDSIWTILWTILTSDPILTLILLLIILVFTLFAFIVNLYKNIRLRKSGILEIDKMSGTEFEKYLKLLLTDLGFTVKLTKKTGDFGADLILDRKIIVQAKRYKSKVGIKAVQEIASAKNYYNANECWVITNYYFTAPAMELAKSNQVRLINRDELMDWMIKSNKSKKK